MLPILFYYEFNISHGDLLVASYLIPETNGAKLLLLLFTVVLFKLSWDAISPLTFDLSFSEHADLPAVCNRQVEGVHALV